MIRYLVLIAALAFVAIRLLRRSGRLRRPVPRTGVRIRAEALTGALGDTGLVAERELRERFRGRIFRYGTLVVVVGVVLAIVIPALRGTSPASTTIGVVGSLPAALRHAVSATGGAAGTAVRFRTEKGTESADADLRAGRVDLAIVDSRSILLQTAIAAGDTSTTARLARAVSTALGVDEAIIAAGFSPSQAARLGRARSLPVRALEPGRSHAARTTSLIGLPLLLFLFVTYNSWILIGVMEEKSSRVVEVLLASVRPLHLLAGKVLGIGLVALTQAALLVAAALAAAKASGSGLATGTTPLFLASILAWLLLGYAFYCWLYAAAGSLAERRDQIQGLIVPMSLPLVFGYVVALTVQGAGTPSTLVEVLAYLPPTAPFAMPTLVSLHAVAWWEFALSAALTVACTIAVAKLAAGIYQRAILRTGQRVRLRDLASSEAS